MGRENVVLFLALGWRRFMWRKSESFTLALLNNVQDKRLGVDE